MSPNYVKNYAKEHNLIKPKRDVIECIKKKSEDVLRDDIPKLTGKAFSDDSRKLSLISNSVDLIVTSPPYFAVQTYAYDNWLRLWFLGYDYKDIHKTQVNTNSEEKYGEFMYKSLKEMFRVLKNNKKCFIIVGDVKKTYSNAGVKITKVINTAEFISKYAKEVGFIINGIIDDRIPQGKKVLNSYLNTEGISTERILCLTKPA
jgi:tRNA G10  N-methylase Trm11